MKNILTFILSFILFDGYCQTSTNSDSLQQWISRYHTIKNLTYSPDTNFVVARKIYSTNADTAVVMDAHQANKNIATILQMPNNIFLKNSSLFSYGNGGAQLSNLYNKTVAKYENVKLSDILYSLNQYFILEQNGLFSLYDTQNKLLQTVANTQTFTTDKTALLFLNFKEGTSNKVAKLTGKDKIILYSTNQDIKNMILSPSGKKLILSLSDPKTQELKLVFVDTISGEVTVPSDIQARKADYIDVSEIQNGKAYFIAFANRYKASNDRFLDIWYGGDNNLRAKQSGSTQYTYYLWNTGTKETYKLPDSYPVYSTIDSDQYFLGFNPLEEFKNLTLHPFLNVNLYNVSSGAYKEIFHQVTKDLVHSSHGKFVMALEPKSKKWSLYDVASSKRTIIDQQGLQNPTFSADFTTVFFESSNDIWAYNIKSQKLTSMKLAKGQEATMINADRKTTNPIFGIKMNMVQNKMLIKAVDRASNSTSYSIYSKGKTKAMIPATKNRIREIAYDQKLRSFATIEENFNMASKIYTAKSGRMDKTEVLAASDRTVAALKQDIIQFKNSVGTPLKGVLYYPTGYVPGKKYPMIVYIYQIKSNLSNMYSVPANEPTGVNRRTLLEHGYFVYEPDIIFDGRGTGLAALDCVHSALDAVEGNLAIDKTRIGLTGHSMGGYETNFIATHSDRFAAFIAGAGKSDIVSSYFSYDYHEEKPNHNRFEVGQFEMNKSFSADKELYMKNNPINYVENVKAPVLLWTGVNDDIVPPEQTMEFFMGLKRNDHPVIALFYQQREHDLGWNTRESKDMSRRALDWWNYFFKNKTDIPWISKEIKRGCLKSEIAFFVGKKKGKQRLS